MNTNMWQHPATQANLETLRARGHRIVEPDDGFLACGMIGPGRLAEPERIADAVAAELNRRRDLEGETVLITAGPTQEPLDPVRFISNRSSGKMGYALAAAAASAGRRRDPGFGSGAPGRAARRDGDSGAHGARDARRGFRAPGARHHRHQGRGGGRFPSGATCRSRR